MDLGLLRSLAQPATTKIILCSLDGLGGLPRPGTGKSELETAALPILHALASRSACGLLRHVGPGITPGSGPGHLGLFGYDPLQHPVGRGVLEALGIDFHLKPGDVAARGNFCTVDGEGRITDRRAGRISTDLCVKLCERLRTITVDGAEIVIEPVKEHRFVLVLRGDGLSGSVWTRDGSRRRYSPSTKRALHAKAVVRRIRRLTGWRMPAEPGRVEDGRPKAICHLGPCVPRAERCWRGQMRLWFRLGHPAAPPPLIRPARLGSRRDKPASPYAL